VYKVTLFGAIALVVANMVGTGVFTTLGFQVEAIENNWSIVLLWALGGVLALCGAVSYSELVRTYPNSVGEMTFLSELYHPCIGFGAGFLTSLFGFSAPIALSALAFGKYLLPAIFPPEFLQWYVVLIVASALVITNSIVHSISLQFGSRVLSVATFFKMILILGVCFGLLFHYQPEFLMSKVPFLESTFTASFGVGLIYVKYAYSGWNAAVYVSEETNQPSKTVPKALLIGTAIVTTFYVLFNASMVFSVPRELLMNKVNVAYIAVEYVFGTSGGIFVACLISFGLISSVSSMVMVSPRILRRTTSLIPMLSKLQTKEGLVPKKEIWFTALISILLIWTGSFESILLYMGIVIQLFSLLCIGGVFILYFRSNKVSSIPLFPIPPLIYMAIALFTFHSLIESKPFEILVSFGIAIVSFSLYFFVKKKVKYV